MGNESAQNDLNYIESYLENEKSYCKFRADDLKFVSFYFIVITFDINSSFQAKMLVIGETVLFFIMFSMWLYILLAGLGVYHAFDDSFVLIGLWVL